MPPTSGRSGLKQPIRSWNLTDRRETAYHEAGHAVAARYLRPSHRISKATIIRRGHALGYVQQRPREERTSLYARWIETQIMVSLAGHVVENRVPRQALDRAVERPAWARRTRPSGLRRSRWRWVRRSSSSRCSPGKPPTGAVHGGRARAARPAVRGDRAAPAREGAGHPPPGQGADRTRRADRRRARGRCSPRSRRRIRS